jgi:hypothetical protein
VSTFSVSNTFRKDEAALMQESYEEVLDPNGPIVLNELEDGISNLDGAMEEELWFRNRR